MAKALAGLLLLGAACGSAQQLANPAPGPSVTIADAELNQPVLAPALTSTTEEVTTTTTEALVVDLPGPQERPPPEAMTTTTLTRITPTTDYSSLPYNGWAIPEYIVACETGGTFSWTAHNASGASGPYQIMPEWFGGELAMNQPHAAQHAMAAKIWDGGRGASNWAACL